jgi:exopolyphosphatase/guanosine-5'-triphosphate,3'-diphosphate pyrophosphatase
VRIAAIDIGTNSIHMVIARATGAPGFEVEDREREVVQVGRGSFRTGRLKAVAVRRTVEALARFVDLARRHEVDRILCTATAAVREAKNGGRFIEAARVGAGITPRIIPAEEEARLIYLGVKSALQLDARPVLIVDIGGGSVQLVVANRERLLHAASAPLGALRLTECLIESDPPSRRDLQRLGRHIRRRAKDALAAVGAHAPALVYGSSGSIHALAQLAHQLETGSPLTQLNGYRLSRARLTQMTRLLQSLDLRGREELPGIDAQRAEIILPGAMVLAHVLAVVGAEGIVISDFGVREGLVTDYLINHAREISALGEIEDLKLRSVTQLLQKFQPEDRHLRHAHQVARFSLDLFDALRGTHRLGERAREVLQFAALLHDVGAAIGYDGHGEHSEYIIRNGMLRGVSADEVELIALVARFHGKARPRKRNAAFRALDRRHRRMVRWLAAMLRIAEGLDRSHYQLVQGLRVLRRGGRLSIRLSARRGARLELWAARRRSDLLSKLCRLRVRVAMERGSEAPVRLSLVRPRVRAAAGEPEAQGARGNGVERRQARHR